MSVSARVARRSVALKAVATDRDVAAEVEVQAALKEGAVTVEYQRKKAKEMVAFFKQQQYDTEVENSQAGPRQALLFPAALEHFWGTLPMPQSRITTSQCNAAAFLSRFYERGSLSTDREFLCDLRPTCSQTSPTMLS